MGCAWHVPAWAWTGCASFPVDCGNGTWPYFRMGFNPLLKVVWPVFGCKTHLKMGQNHQKTWSFQKVDENGSGKWVKTLFRVQNQLKNGSSSISAIHRVWSLRQAVACLGVPVRFQISAGCARAVSVPGFPRSRHAQARPRHAQVNHCVTQPSLPVSSKNVAPHVVYVSRHIKMCLSQHRTASAKPCQPWK